MVLESLLSGTGGTVVFEFYLPFLLTFTLFFGLMDRVNPFGPNQKKLHVIISLIAAFYILIFSPFAGQISTFFATFFAETSLVIVTLLVGMMVVALLTGMGFSKEGWDKVWHRAFGGIVMLGFVVAVALFISSGGLNLLGAAGFGGGIGLSAEDLLIIGMVVITVAAIWFMGRSSED
ncbi:MAG: hypothetical protein J4452_04455 [Candidatus Aenigmarchaeota archaeon]|nr:hypothetical protein [Candidatus Aenigmarchaeota archaeon]